MATPYLGEIMIFAGNFAPKGYAFCNGKLLSISQNQALYSILGTTYGGDGVNTFALPDLRGRAPLSSGQGQGLSNRPLGQSSGEETHTLVVNELPMHLHTFNAANTAGDQPTPAGNFLANDSSGGTPIYNPQPSTGTTAAGSAIGQAGNSMPHDNRQPYLAISYVIALNGVYPSHN